MLQINNLSFCLIIEHLHNAVLYLELIMLLKGNLKLFPLPSSFLLPPPCVDYLVPSPKATTFGKPCRWGKNLAQQLKNPHFPHHKNPYHPKAIFNSSFIYSCRHDSGINFFFQKLCADMSTAWKVSKYGVFSRPYFTAIGLNADQKKLRIWALFTQWSR